MQNVNKGRIFTSMQYTKLCNFNDYIPDFNSSMRIKEMLHQKDFVNLHCYNLSVHFSLETYFSILGDNVAFKLWLYF